MSAEENKNAVRRFVQEVVTRGNMAVFDDLVAADYVEHNPYPGGSAGRDGLKQGSLLLRSAFPDIRSEPQQVLAEGDTVIYHGILSGTHQAEFMGLLPTGKPFRIDELHILRMQDGKLAEHWGLFDNLTMLQQVGALPAVG